MAGQNGAVQCELNEERVWVYDSLANLNVEARLNCGDSVEILGQEKNYVKIRTTSGRVGYVPKDALPNLPAAASNDSNASADHPISLAEAALRARLALEKEHEQSAAPKQVSVAEIPAKGARVPVVATYPVEIPKPPVENTARSAPAIANRAAAWPAAIVTAPVNSLAASSAAANAPVATAPTVEAAPAAEIVLTATAKTAPEAQAAVETPAAASPVPVAPARIERPVSAAAAAPIVAEQPVVARSQAIAAVAAPPAVVSMPVAEPAAAPRPVEIAASAPAIPANATQPAPTNSAVIREHRAKYSDASMDEEDDADASLSAAESARQDCAAYFSAYGLTPNQFRWLMINRKKKFPGICPASLPSLVDYVIIFTHDVGFYNYTMPTPVRVDASGMSDWTPMGMVDTAFVSPSNADKNHREFVWVFHVHRGTFNPAQFSSRRRPQYAKNESNMFGSHASDKTVEDALKFIEENGASR